MGIDIGAEQVREKEMEQPSCNRYVTISLATKSLSYTTHVATAKGMFS